MDYAIRWKWGHRILDRYFTGATMNYRQMISLFIPILVDQAFIMGLNLINTAMISAAGVAAVSAVNMIDSLNIFLFSIFIAVATGGTVVVAQYKGNGNVKKVSEASASAVSVVTLLGLLVGLLGIALHVPLLNILFGSAQADVMSYARVYLIGSCISFAGIAIVEAICGALRGVGSTRASLVLSLIMNILYVLLNFLFIHGFHMGVLGMTIALNIARYGGAVCALYYLFKVDVNLKVRMKELFRVKWEMFRKILFIGFPFATEQMFFNGGKIITQIFIVWMGTYAIAVNAICAALAGAMQIPANALSLTIITVVGICIGSGNIDEARKFTKSFLVLSSMSFVVMGLIILPLFNPLIALFDPPAEIVDDIFLILLVNTLVQIPLWAISFITPSALRAAGDAKYTSVVSMLTMWLFRVVMGYVLGVVLGWGVLGVWIAMDLEWGVRGLIFLKRFYGTKWLQHRLI
ncbi:MATE family efflux transporter [Paenibacillus hunanensis]|uniref:Probable multidrug resistance protein NorM n=1 Tax=Paenibacillus hunanensis TaxID=539262 RepID=A0ABU1J099_9BACL|nr:MATE family efflux transporter [Paenibacillus hunanensis]MDR6244919.1 putative MATE family efflux protein [Paenibacillus hunanensis]WPP41552.1 MATE family efflux transporter [Paenibacillus hunanensis]